jgi:UDP-3-O-[3-hydroxymyristoyl] N-acetylglucosamine deacetylase
MDMGFGERDGQATVSKNGFARQRTLRQSISCTGTGLHSGAKLSLTFAPAPIDHGIVFRRSDVAPRVALIPALWNQVVDTRMCTTLGNPAGTTIGTVEHVMAALAGYNIDNCLITVDGPELPIMDGSAEPFAFLIDCAGVEEQNAARKAIQIVKPVRAGDDHKYASVSPGSHTALSFEIDFDNAVVAKQRLSFSLYDGSFRKELARARTFGFAHEVEALRKMGLARGGSLDNAVVITKDRVLNREGLRFPDEFVRHKLLDALGDLYLAGAPIIGRFEGLRGGHALNNQLLRTLFANKSAWRWTTVTEGAAMPVPLRRRKLAEAIGA